MSDITCNDENEEVGVKMSMDKEVKDRDKL